MNIIKIYDGEDACVQCLGWKRIANTDDGESWKYWAELPAQSAIAVVMGIVKPIECPHCKGTGVEPVQKGLHDERNIEGLFLTFYAIAGIVRILMILGWLQ